jgi:hypothetical protein
MVQWKALVNTVMNLEVPEKAAVSLLAERPLAFEERLRCMELVHPPPHPRSRILENYIS